MINRYYERKGSIRATIFISIFLFFVILISLTLLFPKILLDYSGVLTFYSLLFAIAFFIFNEISNRRKEEEKGLATLENIEQERKVVESQLDFFESLKDMKPPVHGMTLFSSIIWSLPQEINSKSTEPLKTNIFIANDKINTLNEIRDQIWDLVWNHTQKELNKISKEQIFEDALSEVENAFNELKKTLKTIESIIKSFKGI